MKKLLLIIILVVFAIPAFSQETATLNASANVLSALTIDEIQPLAFGNISSTTLGAVKVDAKVPSNNTYTGTTSQAGILKIIGDITTSVNITWPTSVVLEKSLSTDFLTLTLDVSGYESNVQSSSIGLLSGDDVTTNSTNGEYYLWVGGTLGTLTAQPTGLYEGTATFEVSYN